MDEEVELLEFGDDIIPKKNIKNSNDVKLSEKKVNKKIVRKPKKGKIAQLIFCIVSFLFILGCCIYYGSRFIKYYRIYNPKIDTSDGSILLANDIIGKSEFSTGEDEGGLFTSSGNYIYKGKVDNNYLKYNNMLWRIVRINVDNTMDIILDDYINMLAWNSEVVTFKESDIYNYLNNEFLNNIDKDMLVKTSFCTDKVDDLSKINCENKDSDSYVRLLDLTGFLNSVKNKKSYLVNEDEIFWLSDYSEEKIWHVNGSNASLSDSDSFYEVKPVVRLKNTITYTKGDGTKSNPYIVGNSDKPSVGSIVRLGNDNYYVYEINKDNVKLMSEKVLDKTYSFDKDKLTFDIESKDSLADYLNNTYLDGLSYKDLLIENTWYIGSFDKELSSIKKDTVKCKIAIPNMLDIKFDSSVKSYFMSTSDKENMLVYENPLRISKPTTYRSVRVVVSISKNTFNNLEYNDGIFEVK